MQHRGAEEIRKKLAGKTREQQIEYWRTRTAELRSRQQALQKERGIVGRTH
jgi:hypothetical protein